MTPQKYSISYSPRLPVFEKQTVRHIFKVSPKELHWTVTQLKFCYKVSLRYRRESLQKSTEQEILTFIYEVITFNLFYLEQHKHLFNKGATCKCAQLDFCSAVKQVLWARDMWKQLASPANTAILHPCLTVANRTARFSPGAGVPMLGCALELPSLHIPSSQGS